MKPISKYFGAGLVVLGFLGCKKAVEVPPPITQLVSTSVYTSNATAAAALTGIYLSMAGGPPGGGPNGISALLGLSADEFTLYPTSTDGLLTELYSNSLKSITYAPIWSSMYNYIYQANSSLEGLASSSGVTPSMKQQLMGEAKFIRAFCHFYLVSLYGNIPLVTTTNYKINSTISRTGKAQVYQQIITDLKDAQSLLSDDYRTSAGSVITERVRPNKGAATALLARSYLYMQQWDSAEAQVTTLVTNSNQYNLVPNLDSVFLASSTEAIWQLEMPNLGSNTPDGAIFLLSYFSGPSASYPFILRDSLLNNFEVGDNRKINWISTYIDSTVTPNNKYFFPFKYKLYNTGAAPAEYPVLFRLAEQYLIRAEARAHQGAGNAVDDLNVIRNRAGLGNYSGATDKTSLLNAILHERQVELFTEYGHRWLDLKRTGNVDAVMSIVTPNKGGTWNPNSQLYPIPLTDIKADGNLNQNPGYD